MLRTMIERLQIFSSTRSLRAFCLLLCLLTLPGCWRIAGGPRDRVEVTVRDGDTFKPVEDAWVTAHADDAPTTRGRTDDAGRVSLLTRVRRTNGIFAAAPGWMLAEWDLRDRGDDTSIEILAYRPPASFEGYLLPEGFRGTFDVWIIFSQGPTPAPSAPLRGRRAFLTTVPPGAAPQRVRAPINLQAGVVESEREARWGQGSGDPGDRVDTARFRGGASLPLADPQSGPGRFGRPPDFVLPEPEAVAFYELGYPIGAPQSREDREGTLHRFFIGTLAEARRVQEEQATDGSLRAIVLHPGDLAGTGGS